MFVKVERDYEAMSERAARVVAEVVRAEAERRAGAGHRRNARGVCTGIDPKSPGRKELDFSQVTTFNLDEYEGLPPAHPQSYHSFHVGATCSRAWACGSKQTNIL